MAFHDYHPRDGSFPEAVNDQRPDLTPLNLELVPSVICQSFGIPMHEPYYIPAPNMYSYGYGMPGGMRPSESHNPGYQGQYMGEHAHMSHGGGMGYGCMPGDPNGYQQGYHQARMYPYIPSPYAQRQRQVSYPSHNEIYNTAMYRRPDNAGMDMCMPTNSAQVSGALLDILLQYFCVFANVL